MKFADESACLTADNLQNEIVNSSRGCPSAHRYLSQFFVKNTGTTNLALTAPPDTNLHWMEWDFVG
jgi:hypothetical protein